MSEHISFSVTDDSALDQDTSNLSIVSADEDLIVVSNPSTQLQEVPEYSAEMRSKIDVVKRQTNYTDDDFITEKIKQQNGNEINVIKEYMGIPLQKIQTPMKTLNQEIYRQFRDHMRVTKKPFAHMR